MNTKIISITHKHLMEMVLIACKSQMERISKKLKYQLLLNWD